MSMRGKPLLALLCAACLFALASCRAETSGTKRPDDAPQSSHSSALEAEPPVQTGETSQPEPSVPAPAADPASAAQDAYVRVLEDLLYRCTTPDGECWPPLDEENCVGFEDMSRNTFALADVDGDGREELVLLTRPNIYAGYRGYVLDYDADLDHVRVQFEGFPSFTFYSNGALAEDDSHAQGVWADDFWPHTLYRYLPGTDSYEEAGHVSAWEKKVSDRMPDALPPFPTEKDISGAGILYYIDPRTEYSVLEGRFSMAVDESVYLEWLEPILGDAVPLELEYLPLTEENIQRITPAA